MANSNESELQNAVPNSNKETLEQQANLKAGVGGAAVVKDETGFKRVSIDINDPDKQKELIDLAWYLGIADPIYKKADIKIERLQNGKTVAETVKKSVFDHFEYPNVAGKKFDEWVKQTFGEDCCVDPKTKEVYKLVPNNAPAPQPKTDEVVQPHTPAEVPTDPENN